MILKGFNKRMAELYSHLSFKGIVNVNENGENEVIVSYDTKEPFNINISYNKKTLDLINKLELLIEQRINEIVRFYR